MNKWVKRMAVKEGLIPFPGLICEIVNSVGQGKFGKFQKPLAVSTMLKTLLCV